MELFYLTWGSEGRDYASPLSLGFQRQGLYLSCVLGLCQHKDMLVKSDSSSSNIRSWVFPIR